MNDNRPPGADAAEVAPPRRAPSLSERLRERRNRLAGRLLVLGMAVLLLLYLAPIVTR